MHLHPYYGNCKTADSLKELDPFISWRPYIRIDKNYSFQGVTGLGNEGDTNRIIEVYVKNSPSTTFEVQYILNGVYAKAVYCHIPVYYGAYGQTTGYYTFTGLHTKVLYIKIDSRITALNALVKNVTGLEELYIDAPSCQSWGGTQMDWQYSTLKRCTFLTSDKCTSLSNLS